MKTGEYYLGRIEKHFIMHRIQENKPVYIQPHKGFLHVYPMRPPNPLFIIKPKPAPANRDK